MELGPLHQVAAEAEEDMNRGATVFQQFLCGNCGVKQTIGTPNQFFTQGKCEECGHVTDLDITGCNYMAVYTNARLERK